MLERGDERHDSLELRLQREKLLVMCQCLPDNGGSKCVEKINIIIIEVEKEETSLSISLVKQWGKYYYYSVPSSIIIY